MTHPWSPWEGKHWVCVAICWTHSLDIDTRVRILIVDNKIYLCWRIANASDKHCYHLVATRQVVAAWVPIFSLTKYILTVQGCLDCSSAAANTLLSSHISLMVLKDAAYEFNYLSNLSTCSKNSTLQALRYSRTFIRPSIASSVSLKYSWQYWGIYYSGFDSLIKLYAWSCKANNHVPGPCSACNLEKPMILLYCRNWCWKWHYLSLCVVVSYFDYSILWLNCNDLNPLWLDIKIFIWPG